MQTRRGAGKPTAALRCVQVTAAVDAAAAAGAGNALMGASGQATLAQQLRAEMGATYRPGSLQVFLPAGRPISLQLIKGRCHQMYCIGPAASRNDSSASRRRWA